MKLMQFKRFLSTGLLLLFIGLTSRSAAIENGSFEDGSPGGIPKGWEYRVGNARSECYLIDNIATEGRQALFLKNASPWKPGVYSCVLQQVPLRPNLRYRLSCKLKGENVNNFADWRMFIEQYVI